MTLPDCPSCDAAQTLEAIRSDTRGAKWCLCSCCGKTCLVDANGVVVHLGS